MVIRTKQPWEIPWSAVTPERVYRSRREFMRVAAAGTIGAAAGSLMAGCEAAPEAAQAQLAARRNPQFVADDKLNSFEEITGYNNFYEFGAQKNDPVRHAGQLKTRPWTVTVDGLVEKPGDWAMDDLIGLRDLEERVYRLRCVEAWSMVIPWIGYPLKAVLEKVQPTARAKYVAFQTLVRPAEMPGQRTGILEWPYVEGLRLDEAMHPLTLVSLGLYGRLLPNQNGAPVRLVVPWKYGFKSIKSIVRISLVESQPPTSWNKQTPHEYGFYSNVNPTVDHPRWSQARERRIPDLFKNTPTLMFNGYGDQVARLYDGMDLRKYY